MSILIKGMEMPTSCYGCPFFRQWDYWKKDDEVDVLSKCKRTGEFTWESVNGYLPDCPLIPAADVREVKWIPVTERLPEKNGVYLVTGRWGNKEPEVWACKFEDWGAVCGWLNDALAPPVLAWMPLPEPPKEET